MCSLLLVGLFLRLLFSMVFLRRRLLQFLLLLSHHRLFLHLPSLPIFLRRLLLLVVVLLIIVKS